MNKDDKLINT